MSSYLFSLNWWIFSAEFRSFCLPTSPHFSSKGLVIDEKTQCNIFDSFFNADVLCHRLMKFLFPSPTAPHIAAYLDPHFRQFVLQRVKFRHFLHVMSCIA